MGKTYVFGMKNFHSSFEKLKIISFWYEKHMFSGF